MFTSSKDSKLRSLVNDVNHKFTVKVRKWPKHYTLIFFLWQTENKDKLRLSKQNISGNYTDRLKREENEKKWLPNCERVWDVFVMTEYMYIKSCLYRQSPLTISYITLKPSPLDTQITPLHTKNPISQSQYRLHLYFFTEFKHRYDSRKPIDNVPKYHFLSNIFKFWVIC